MSKGLSPEVASRLLARNIVAQPSVAGYCCSKLNMSFMPNDDGSALLQAFCERASMVGRLTGGDVEEVLASFPNQQFARAMKVQAAAEDRSSVDRYIESLQRYAEAESLRTLIGSLQLQLADSNPDLDNIKGQLANGIIRANVATTELRDLGYYAEEAETMIDMILSGNRPGRSVGFGPALDEYMWFDPGTISIVAGRPGSGKTSFVTSSMLTAASPEKPEAFFSIEMPGYSIAQRIACEAAGVSLHDINRRKVTADEVAAVKRELRSLQSRGIFVDDGVVSMDDIYYRSLSLPDRPVTIWIDYGEKVDVSNARQGRRDLELGYVYTKAKQIAKSLKCHVVVLAQLGRSVEEREDKWPMLSDISQSGAAEKDADYIALLMRPEYYLVRGLNCRLLSPGDARGVAYCNVAKSRNGPVDVVRLSYESKLMKFGEYVPEDKEVYDPDNAGVSVVSGEGPTADPDLCESDWEAVGDDE
jgi:replicative DNA helicase